MMRKSVVKAVPSRAPFMTSAMWFVWLLRSDIRGDAALSDVSAQREFIAWWMLWAANEYPAVFSWDHEHADIAMELVAFHSGGFCPRLLVRLYAARGDLQQAFPLHDPDSLADYLCWYRLNGPRELAAAPALPKACLAVTEAPSKRRPWCLDDTRVPRIAIALSYSTPNVLQGSFDDPGTRRALAAWYVTYGRSLIPSPTPPVPTPATVERKGSMRNDGLNLVGFVNGRSGLGEDVRMMAAGLSSVGVPHVLLDAASRTQKVQSDEMAHRPISERPLFATSVYCMSAFDMATLYLMRGPEFFSGQYRIGYWPWELPRFPDVWTAVYDLVDEIWTGSEFSANAYRANCPKPVTCLPAPVAVPEVQRRTLTMFSKGAFVFTYPFDPNSYFDRKNPIALVRAFHIAFPRKDRTVALLLRVNGTLSHGASRDALLREIGTDQRIVVMEGTLDRTESLSMTASCDCLVFPHRAEGFGRNIAEAILLGVPVLATAFSGCEDFLASGEGLEFGLQEIGIGQYPFGEGQLWAEPVVTDMAEKMQLRRAAKRSHRGVEWERLVLRARQFAENYAPDVTGRASVARLEALQSISLTGGSGPLSVPVRSAAAFSGVRH
jgi:hypothetical protein